MIKTKKVVTMSGTVFNIYIQMERKSTRRKKFYTWKYSKGLFKITNLTTGYSE